MPSFSHRSAELEIIDVANLAATDRQEIARDLHVINRFLGGYRVTYDGVRRLWPRGQRRLTVLDVGAGGGDGAQELVVRARRDGLTVRVVAVDLNHTCLQHARARRDDDQVQVVQADALALPFAEQSFDIATCSLVMHHFDDPSAVALLTAMLAVSRLGVVVNDLHRHPLAWLGVVVLTRLFGACKTVQHDGPLSVLRGFKRGDLSALAQTSGLPMELRWRWAFRYQLLLRRIADRQIDAH